MIQCKILSVGVEVTCRIFMLSAQPVRTYAECGIFNYRLDWELVSFEVFGGFFLVFGSKILR